MKWRYIWLFVLLLAFPGKSQALPSLKNKLIFTREADVWMMNSDGKEQRRIWRVPKGYGNFGGFSRDGAKALSFNGFNLYIHDLNRRSLRRLLLWNAGMGTFIAFPAFSPDGKTVLCTIGSVQLDVIDSRIVKLQVSETYSVLEDWGAIQKAALHPDLGEAYSTLHGARWSWDGKKIVFVSGGFDLVDSRNCWRLEIWTMNSDGSGAQRITNNSQRDDMPSFSPKADRVVFMRHFSDPADINVSGNDIFISDANGTNERRLTSNQNFAGSSFSAYSSYPAAPLFGPNGDLVAVNRSDGIYRISAEGKNLRKLASGLLVQWMY